MTIISNIIGGLGNQMFQYAAGYSLSQRTGQSLKLHLNDYNFINDRKFELENVFELKATFASSSDVKKIIGNKGNLYTRKLLYKLGLSRNILKEKPYILNKFFFEVNGPIYLDGYWQNYNYFSKETKRIRELFTFNCLTNEEKRLFFKNNNKSSNNNISVHIRKADYVNQDKNVKIFFSLENKYYMEAFKIMRLKVNNPFFHIFSDDIEWVKNNIELQNCNFKIVSPSSSVGKDMALMSACQHHIIANSSFSWWAAWLNNSIEKVVVSPKKWLNSNKQPNGLNLPSWIHI